MLSRGIGLHRQSLVSPSSLRSALDVIAILATPSVASDYAVLDGSTVLMAAVRTYDYVITVETVVELRYEVLVTVMTVQRGIDYPLVVLESILVVQTHLSTQALYRVLNSLDYLSSSFLGYALRLVLVLVALHEISL